MDGWKYTHDFKNNGARNIEKSEDKWKIMFEFGGFKN